MADLAHDFVMLLAGLGGNSSAVDGAELAQYAHALDCLLSILACNDGVQTCIVKARAAAMQSTVSRRRGSLSRRSGICMSTLEFWA